MSVVLILLLFIENFQVFQVTAKLPQETCSTTEDNLFIVVDSSSEIDLTFKRIKHFLQYFIVRRDYSSQSTICIIEPFHEINWRFSNFSSIQEIFVQLDKFKKTMRSNSSHDNTISTLNKYVLFVDTFFSEFKSTYGMQSIVLAWFSGCFENCRKTIRFFEGYELENLRKMFLFLTTTTKYLDYSISNYLTLIDVHLFPKDNLSEYDVVSIYLCKLCPPGWNQMSNKNDPAILNCYKRFISPFKLNWYDASKQCRMMYSDLPVIETFNELTFIISKLKEKISNEFHESIETFIIHVGLTKSVSEKNNLQWTNKRPFLLQKNIESKNELNNCVVLKYSMDNDSISEMDQISWEFIDCDEKISNIVLCGRSMDATRYKPSQLYDIKSKKFQKPTLLLKEHNDSIGSFAWGDDYITDEKYVKQYSHMMFNCEDRLNTFITYTKVCNGKYDCENKRDEVICECFHGCLFNEFVCINPNANDRFPVRQFYPIEAKCDAHQDCPDNSDEEDCDECTERRCSDGTCVPRHWLSRDGDQCKLKHNNNGTIFIDAIGEVFFVPTEYEVVICSAIEVTPTVSTLTNYTNNFSWAPKCIYLRGRSGRPTGCDDLSHLHDCVDFICSEEFIKCHQSFCIPFYYINDEIRDCPHGEDEYVDKNSNINCPYVCNGYRFNCIHNVNICDGFVDCPYCDDELNCNVTCPRGFKCFGSATIVNKFSKVIEIESFRIFDIQTKFLNLNGLDLSRLKETYILPKLLELHASNCNLVSLEYMFVEKFKILLFKLDLSYNKFTKLSIGDKNIPFFALLFLNLTGNYYLSFFRGELDNTNMDLSHTDLTLLDVNYWRSNVLSYLNLSNTKIKYLRNLHVVNSLKILDIRNTQLNDNYAINFLQKISIKSALYTDNNKYCCPQVVGKSLPSEKCHAPFDSISSCEDLIGNVFKRSLLFTVATCSLVGNIVVLSFRIYYDKGILSKGYGVFVTNLGISDFVMGVYLTIIVSADFYFRDNYVLYEKNWRVSYLCKISGFLSTLSSETSTFFILLITLDRFLKIRFPFGNYSLTKRLICILVVASWLIGFVLALIPIVYPEWTIYSSNGMCVGLPLTKDHQQGWQYAFWIFVVLNFILFLSISIGQVLIFYSMSNQRMTRDSISSSRREQEIDVAKQLSIVALSNFLCWFPTCVTGLMSINGHNLSPDTYAWFVIFVLPLNAALNPLIYTIPAIYKKWRKFKMRI